MFTCEPSLLVNVTDSHIVHGCTYSSACVAVASSVSKLVATTTRTMLLFQNGQTARVVMSKADSLFLGGCQEAVKPLDVLIPIAEHLPCEGAAR